MNEYDLAGFNEEEQKELVKLGIPADRAVALKLIKMFPSISELVIKESLPQIKIKNNWKKDRFYK